MVFTAFSGSHQDAIKKGSPRSRTAACGEFPICPIDPKDLGRSLRKPYRVQQQSGKGVVAYLLERTTESDAPALQIEFSASSANQRHQGRRGDLQEIWAAFQAEYIVGAPPFLLRGHHDDSDEETNRLTRCGEGQR